jgi:hypothetical protein
MTDGSSQYSTNKLTHARALLASRDVSVGEVAATLAVNRSTLYRALARKGKVMLHSA